MTTSVTSCVPQHDTKPARPRPQRARPRPKQRPERTRPRPRPISWSQTGLVLRPTVSNHITARFTKDLEIYLKIVFKFVIKLSKLRDLRSLVNRDPDLQTCSSSACANPITYVQVTQPKDQRKPAGLVLHYRNATREHCTYVDRCSSVHYGCNVIICALEATLPHHFRCRRSSSLFTSQAQVIAFLTQSVSLSQ